MGNEGRNIMAKTDIHYLELLQVGQRIQSREMSSEDVTRTLLHRIDSVDTGLHSYATLMAEQALSDALNQGE